MIFNVSAFSALRDFNDQYHYVKEQAQWLVLGIVSMFFFSIYPYKKLSHIAAPFLIGSVILLIAVFIRGIGIQALGAARWIDLGFITLQPSELIKLAVIIYLSARLAVEKNIALSRFLIFLLIVAGPIILQPDLGSAGIIIGVAIAVYFISGAPLAQFMSLAGVLAGGLVFLAFSAPYRLERIKTFFNHQSDPQGTSYHLQQILIAIGSGGWFGVGLGKSRQKYAYLPEVTTDSVFAVIAEEIGFIGCTVVLALLFLLVLEGFKVARRAPDRFGFLLASGISSVLALQMVVNLGSMVSLLPLTGVPLPFLSYGGSSLIISFSMVGILVNIAKQS